MLSKQMSKKCPLCDEEMEEIIERMRFFSREVRYLICYKCGKVMEKEETVEIYGG